MSAIDHQMSHAAFSLLPMPQDIASKLVSNKHATPLLGCSKCVYMLSRLLAQQSHQKGPQNTPTLIALLQILRGHSITCCARLSTCKLQQVHPSVCTCTQILSDQFCHFMKYFHAYKINSQPNKDAIACKFDNYQSSQLKHSFIR